MENKGSRNQNRLGFFPMAIFINLEDCRRKKKYLLFQYRYILLMRALSSVVLPYYSMSGRYIAGTQPRATCQVIAPSSGCDVSTENLQSEQHDWYVIIIHLLTIKSKPSPLSILIHCLLSTRKLGNAATEHLGKLIVWTAVGNVLHMALHQISLQFIFW